MATRGLSLEFYARVGRRYDMPRYLNPVAWFYEPHVGESVMLEMMHEAGVTVIFRQRLRETAGEQEQGASISAITFENGESLGDVRVRARCRWSGRQARASLWSSPHRHQQSGQPCPPGPSRSTTIRNAMNFSSLDREDPQSKCWLQQLGRVLHRPHRQEL
jgi:FAD dependent oxidoreductase